MSIKEVNNGNGASQQHEQVSNRKLTFVSKHYVLISPKSESQGELFFGPNTKKRPNGSIKTRMTAAQTSRRWTVGVAGALTMMIGTIVGLILLAL